MSARTSSERIAAALGAIRHYTRRDHEALVAAPPDALDLVAAGQYLAGELAAHLDTTTDDVLEDLIRTLLAADPPEKP